MPNWCDCRASITGNAVLIAEIKGILESDDPELLNYMVPQPQWPEDSQDWYNWRISTWGCKWDVSDVYVSDLDDNSIEFGFQSPWAPPVDAFLTWAQNNESVTFTLNYFEPGCAFVGIATWDGEYFDDQYISSDMDAHEYERVAREEWGYGFDEEIEPFTEWYQDGVEELGLDKTLGLDKEKK